MYVSTASLWQAELVVQCNSCLQMHPANAAGTEVFTADNEAIYHYLIWVRLTLLWPVQGLALGSCSRAPHHTVCEALCAVYPSCVPCQLCSQHHRLQLPCLKPCLPASAAVACQTAAIKMSSQLLGVDSQLHRQLSAKRHSTWSWIM